MHIDYNDYTIKLQSAIFLELLREARVICGFVELYRVPSGCEPVLLTAVQRLVGAHKVLMCLHTRYVCWC
jgi:hypothetical protein